MSVNVKPVETEIYDVFVDGCKPPWYLFWFKKWQSLLNEGVQEAFQEFANNYEHQSELPEEFSPLPNVYIHYVITGLEWSEMSVVFKAKASVSALIDGKNVTFIPHSADQQNEIRPIPMTNWTMKSRSDPDSNLLQGVRISNEFINAVMWVASRSNLTMYQGSAQVLDTMINGTISYDPPVIRVEENNLLSLDIGRGLLLATCLPLEDRSKPSSTLFKAEFSHLIGSGQMAVMTMEGKTGVRATLDILDFSKMQTKPFEPKLPLPESFESELMKTGISQLQPIVNQYLEGRPFYLPEKVAPLVASPQVHLFSTGNGTGYIEIISYCTCSNSTRSLFAVCDLRSHICDSKKPLHVTKESTMLPSTTEFSLKNSFKKSFEEFKDIAKKIILPGRDDKNNDLNSTLSDKQPLNFSKIFDLSKKRDSNFYGFHFTMFEFTSDCQLRFAGATAKTFWIWKTERCTPIYFHGQMSHQFYFLSDEKFVLGCEDSDCQICSYNFPNFSHSDKSCQTLPESPAQSFQVGRPLFYSWKSASEETNFIANVFFGADYCLFHDRYIEPQILSTHTNLGSGQMKTCTKTQSSAYIRYSISSNNTAVLKADWDCLDNCYGCIFKVSDVIIGSCMDYKDDTKIIFTKTIEEIEPIPIHRKFSTDEVIYLASGLIVLIVCIGFIILMIFYLKKRTRPTTASLKTAFKTANINESIKNSRQNFQNFLQKHFGIRFLVLKQEDAKIIRDEILQNLMVLTNGILAIYFAFSWKSDNNPLLIIHEKFRTGITMSVDVIDTSNIVVFASRLNLISYLVNLINGSLAIAIFLLWCITKTGQRRTWKQIRFLSSVTMLGSIFVMLAAIIFSTYFDGLVVVRQGMGYFITDNKSVHKFANEVLKVSLRGLSLTVISFTIVFLFHSVGGGLYTGTLIYRLLHLNSKKSSMEVLTTLLVILTIIQPFICLHPVIIWSQDSNQNSTFLLLIILIWFLPVCIHVLIRAITNQSLKQCPPVKDKTSQEPTEDSKVSTAQLKSSNRLKSDKYRVNTRLTPTQSSRTVEDKTEEIPKVEIKISSRRQKLIKFFDVFVHLFQLTFFLTSFTVITHYIVNTELISQRQNLQEFVLPAIVSVFFSTVSISHLVLSIVLDESRKDSPLVFKDQDLEQARSQLRMSLRRRLSMMDKGVGMRRDYSLQRQTFMEAAALYEAKRLRPQEGSSLPPGLDLSSSLRGSEIPLDASFKVRVKNKPNTGQSTLEKPEEIPLEPVTSSQDILTENAPDDFDEDQKDESCCGKFKRFKSFILETKEYEDPQTHGWRIKFRRLCLVVGVLFFSYTTIHSLVVTQSYSSKQEIQKILDYAGTNLTWPDSGSVLDDVFQVYNDMERLKCYLMIGSTITFWLSLILDILSCKTTNLNRKSWCLTGSRVANFVGSLMVFASVIVVGLPDYLTASNLDDICPFCGLTFNRTVRQIAEFSIGLFFACLFTFQLFPILVTIAPALVRASVLILIHPQLQIENSDVSNLRMTILQRVIQFSSLLTFPITFISMAIVQQYQQDIHVTLLIVAFWIVPPFVLYSGLHFAQKYRRYIILLYVYYAFNMFYVGLLASVLFYSLTFNKVLEMLENLITEPTFWGGFIAQISLCNVVISDMLYMTVF